MEEKMKETNKETIKTDEEIKQTFINRLKKARIEKNYSQEKLAEDSGVTKTTISNYERGKNDPSLYVISRIARELDVSIDYLVGNKQSDSSTISTISDVIRIIETLGDTIGISIEKIESFLPAGMGQPRTGMTIGRVDSFIDNYLEEKKNMEILVERETIEPYLYKLWIKDIIKKYENTPIESEEDIHGNN